MNKNLINKFVIFFCYPILVLSLSGLFIYLPDIIIVTPVLVSSIFNWFAQDKTVVIENIPVVEYITLDRYSTEEYNIYKSKFLTQITDFEAIEQLNRLQARLQPLDRTSLNTRSPEDVVKSYIKDFLIECHGNPKDFTWAQYISYLFNQEGYILRLQFTIKGEIPTLTLGEYLELHNQFYTEREILKLRLSVVDYMEANDIEWYSIHGSWGSLDTPKLKSELLSELDENYLKKKEGIDRLHENMAKTTYKTTEYYIGWIRNKMETDVRMYKTFRDDFRTAEALESFRQATNKTRLEKLDTTMSEMRQDLEMEYHEKMKEILKSI